MRYSEEKNKTKGQKQSYLDSIKNLIEKRQKEYDEKRFDNLNKIINEPEKSRMEYNSMLGWPLTEKIKLPLDVKEELLAEEPDGYDIYRIKFEIFEDFFFYGLLFRHRNQKLPIVICQHGGLGTPEFCSGIYNGDTANYNHMTERITKCKVHTFAPQILLWDKEAYGIDYDREDLDAKLKQLGGSIAALEIYCIRSAISYFERQMYIRKERIGMAGLSYGGFYTLFTTASDTRIKAALCSSYFNDAYRYSWVDFTWKNSAERFLNSEVALLCYPRKLWLSVGLEDKCFEIDTAKKEYQRLCDEIESCNIDKDWLNFEMYKADHWFCPKDDFVIAFTEELKK